jgi:hypothetical protein
MKSKLIGLGLVMVIAMVGLILFLGFHDEKVDYSEATKKVEITATK